MLQIILGTYLLLALGAMLLLWMALAAANMHEMDDGSDRQRQYRIAMALSNLKNARIRATSGRLEDHAPS